jgi:hypothetical protein
MIWDVEVGCVSEKLRGEVKGTMAEIFHLLCFVQQLLLVSRGMPRKNFDFLKITRGAI